MSNREHIEPPKKIAVIESIRGLAALLVVFYHLPGWNKVVSTSNFVSNGYLMVDLFFVLSGFVIFKAYGGQIEKKSDLFRFQFLRFGRLYPIHLLFISIFLCYTATPFLQTNWAALAQQLLLVQAIGPNDSRGYFNPQAWSISVEFYVYFLFGLLVLYFRKKQIQIYWIFFVCSVALLSTRYFFSDFNKELGSWSDLLNCIAGFFMGCIAANWDTRYRWNISSIWPIAIFLITLIFLAFKINNLYDVLIYPLSAALILALTQSKDGMLKILLSCAPLVFIGEISYSIYMSHYAIIYLFEERLRDGLLRRLDSMLGTQLNAPLAGSLPIPDSLLKYSSFFLVLIIVSYLSYCLIERPFRRYSRGLIGAPDLPKAG